MDSRDDYQGDMDEMHDDSRIQRLLEELRSTFAEAPDEHITQRHLSAMREATGEPAGEAGWWGRLRERHETRRNPMPALIPRWLVAGVAVLFGLTGGLAAADVLPDSAQSVVARTVSNVGVDLPDPDDKAENAGNEENGDDVEGQDEPADPEANDHGQNVSDFVHETNLEGCEKGQAVSEIASSKSQGNEEAPGRSDDHDPCAEGGNGADVDITDDAPGNSTTHRQDGGAGVDDEAAGPPEGVGPSEAAGPPEGAGPPSG